MSYMKDRIAHRSGSIYTIGDANPYLGTRVRVTWLKSWGSKPAGYTAEGVLERTFVIRGRTLIGEVVVNNRRLSCPWSRNYLQVEPLA